MKITGPLSFLILVTILSGRAASAEPKFPFAIPFETGASGFYPGDRITVTALRGDRPHVEPGGSYLVEGNYSLAADDGADVAFYCTTRGPSGLTPVDRSQHVRIAKGSGTFHLYKTNEADGWFHVSFYPEKSGLRHGGVYFGEKGRENTIMRQQDWFREFQVENNNNPANRALLAYLGDPVVAPLGLDPLYRREKLLKAFTSLCQQADLIITRLAVDDSEFPFLLFGALDGNHKLPEKALFEQQQGYAYGGSVRRSFGNDTTYFSVNMIPSTQYPEGQETACNRRLLLRLEMLADRARQGP